MIILNKKWQSNRLEKYIDDTSKIPIQQQISNLREFDGYGILRINDLPGLINKANYVDALIIKQTILDNYTYASVNIRVKTIDKTQEDELIILLETMPKFTEISEELKIYFEKVINKGYVAMATERADDDVVSSDITKVKFGKN